MAIWFIIHDEEVITLNEFLFFYKLKPSTHYGYFEFSPWDKQTKIVHEFPTSFMIGSHVTFLCLENLRC